MLDVGQIFEALLTALAFLVFYSFRGLVTEVKELRQEIHSLNLKIAEILARDSVFEVRLSRLEKKEGYDEN